MSSPNKKLLSDLGKLAAKYRAKDWEELATWLDDPRQRATLRTLLLELAAASGSSRKASPGKPRKPSRASKVREKLRTIRADDADRADLLEDIWLKLRQRELLPTLSTLRAFAEAMGSKGLKSTRRDQAVTELMELLIKLPGDSLEQRMRQTVVDDRRLGDEYQGWVRLILERPGESTDRS